MEQEKIETKHVTTVEYGDQYNNHLLEQYKMYVEMADRVSGRRVKTTEFYVSLLSVLLAVLSFVVSKDTSGAFSGFQNIVFVAVALLGITLCATWYVNINSYKQLNKLKFKVVHEMEQKLPFPCYKREWEILKEEEKEKSKEEQAIIKQEEQAKKKSEAYVRLTQIEKYVPYIMAIPYVLLLLYAFYKILF